MAHTLQRTDEELDGVLNAAADRADTGGSKYPGMTYEAGMEAGLSWALGLREEHPYEDEDDEPPAGGAE